MKILMLLASAICGLSSHAFQDSSYGIALRRAPQANLVCRDGLQVSVRHNLAYTAGHAYNWRMAISQDTDKDGWFVLDLYELGGGQPPVLMSICKSETPLAVRPALVHIPHGGSYGYYTDYFPDGRCIDLAGCTCRDGRQVIMNQTCH